MTFSSEEEEFIVHQARSGWYETLRIALHNDQLSYEEQLELINCAREVVELLISHCRSLEELIYNLTTAELEIPALKSELFNSNLCVVILTIEEPMNLCHQVDIALPSCIKQLESFALNLDSSLIFRAFNQASKLYLTIINTSWKLRDEAIKLAYQKRILEARLKRHLDSLENNNDAD